MRKILLKCQFWWCWRIFLEFIVGSEIKVFLMWIDGLFFFSLLLEFFSITLNFNSHFPLLFMTKTFIHISNRSTQNEGKLISFIHTKENLKHEAPGNHNLNYINFYSNAKVKQNNENPIFISYFGDKKRSTLTYISKYYHEIFKLYRN